MLDFLMVQGDYFLRVMVAACCGAAIGYERESRLKMAGIRTHTVVALASALMMVISKYGFFDVVIKESINLDPSRIAAGVVTAIGFLGAGIILNRKTSISGVTTAAGIWATLGIGMAVGAGMWTLGISATLLLLLIQVLFHKRLRIFKDNSAGRVLIRLKRGTDIQAGLDGIFEDLKVKVVETHLSLYDDEYMEASIGVVFPNSFEVKDLAVLMERHPEILSIDT